MSAEVQQPAASMHEPKASSLPQVVAAAVAFGLAAACFLHFGVTARGFISALFVIILVALAAIDLEQRILPNRIVLPSTAVILLLQIAFFPGHTLEWVLSTLGAGFFFLLAYLTYRTGLGQGDVKFALLLGAGLGKGVVLGVFVGMFFAGIAGIVILAREGLQARKKAIPLGPFLVVGAIISLFFNGAAFISFT
jgi:prepilin signal peptidase PulO-like enzyme (type II secretory pathway)